MRKLIIALFMPVTILFGVCHLAIFAVVDLFGMFFSLMTKESYPSFSITKYVFVESLNYYRGIFVD